jgi:hypothetical protein
MAKPLPGAKESPSEINVLADLSLEELRRRWAQVFKRPVPPSSHREFLTGSLAYELQAQAQGALRALSHRALCSTARALVGGTSKRHLLGPIRPGTRLLRTWQGETHEVLALEKGFSYRGATYTSLSEIARMITGARWSGPVFFGLKTPRPKKPKPSSGGGA